MSDRELHLALERVGPRFTLGDLLLSEGPALDDSADALRQRVIFAVHLSGGHLDVDEETREVIYVVPVRVRAAILARDVSERARRARRAAWRTTMRAVRAAFGSFLVVSAALTALAVIALVVIALSRGHQGRGGGGGSTPVLPTYVGHGRGVNADFWYYLWMRDLIELAYWNDVMRFERARAFERAHGVAEGVPVSKPRVGGSGHGGGGGGGDDGGSGDPAGRANAPPPTNVGPRRGGDGVDGDEEEEEDDWLDRDRELSFFESIFAFVFGRGDPNDNLETRRWRAVGALLRVNKGCVFAEQVAPFLDTYLLTKEDHSEVRNGLFAVVFDLVAHARRLFRRKADAERDVRRMHEGYMLEVLTRFGGFAEASDAGELIYVFPSLQVTARADEPSSSRLMPSRSVQAPTPPPIYERVRPLWESGAKMPLVVALGFLNVALIFIFRAAGGMDFKPPRQSQLPRRAEQTMGRRAGRFRDAAPTTSTVPIDDYGEPPLVILILELFPKLLKLLMPLLLVYAGIFFLVPTSRALYIAVENRRIKRRNDVRKRRAQEILSTSVQMIDKQSRARGKQALEVV